MQTLTLTLIVSILFAFPLLRSPRNSARAYSIFDSTSKKSPVKIRPSMASTKQFWHQSPEKKVYRKVSQFSETCEEPQCNFV